MTKRAAKLLLLVVLTLVLISGCASHQSAPESFDKENTYFAFDITDEDGAPVHNATVLTNESAELNNKIIKRAEISLEVLDLDQILESITARVKESKGYIQSSSRNVYNDVNRVNLTLRVPVAIFDAIFQEISSLGEVKSDRITTQDVTEEYIDLEVRLTTLEAKQETFTALLKKAETIEDILKVENELDRVVYEIERIKGRMQYLDRQVDMSTITLTLTENNPTSTNNINFVKRLKYVIEDGWGSMLNFMSNVILGFVWLMPFLPIIFIVLFVVRKLWRKIRSRKSKKIDV